MQKKHKISCCSIAGFLSLLFLIYACNSSRSLRGTSLSFKVFAKQFPELALPYHYNADSLEADPSDSLKLHHLKEAGFIPDSIRSPKGESDSSTAVYAIGKGETPEAQWLFLKEVTPASRQVYVLIYSRNDSLLAVKKVASRSRKEGDKTLTFKWTQNHLLNLYERTDLGKGFVANSREVYSLSDDHHLQLILTNKDGSQSK